MDNMPCYEISTPGEIHVNDAFFTPRMDTVREKMLPYQWDALGDRIPGAEPSHCLKNLRIAAGLEEGTFGGFVFQDSDLYKWMEGAAYSLMTHPDPALEHTLDETVHLLGQVQRPDGYLNSYYIINGLDKRWTNVMNNHELYCAGHLIEAAVAYHQATGKDRFLRIARRVADHIGSVFGPDEDKLHGYPGHELIELALVRLYRETGEGRYLTLADYFVRERGREPNFLQQEIDRAGGEFWWKNSPLGLMYYQAAKPVCEQGDAEGHAVRAVYLYSGMAAVAKETGDRALFAACEALWESVTRRRMYITGGIGSSAHGEAFTFDYDLPNDTAYAETCASIGLVFFARRMLEIKPRGEYADVMERALYNGILSGMSLDGTKFFYVNPLEVVPLACEKDQLRRHVQVQRQAWFGCACCPPNLARLIASIGSYAYSCSADTLYVQLYLGGSYQARVGDAQASLKVRSDYPWNGAVSLRAAGGRYTLALRIPGWCRRYTLTIDGKAATPPVRDGFALLEADWADQEIRLELDMPVERIAADDRVRADTGKVALMRGPVVYCLEEADNGAELHRVSLAAEPGFETAWQPELLGGVVTIAAKGFRRARPCAKGALYAPADPVSLVETQLRFIPYYAWANRTPGEMTVWVRE